MRQRGSCAHLSNPVSTLFKNAFTGFSAGHPFLCPEAEAQSEAVSPGTACWPHSNIPEFCSRPLRFECHWSFLLLFSCPAHHLLRQKPSGTLVSSCNPGVTKIQPPPLCRKHVLQSPGDKTNLKKSWCISFILSLPLHLLNKRTVSLGFEAHKTTRRSPHQYKLSPQCIKQP